MRDEGRIAKPAQHASRPYRRWKAIALAMLRGACFGIAIIAIPLSVGVMLSVEELSKGPRGRGWKMASAAAVIVLFCAALSAILFGISAALSSAPRDTQDDGPDFAFLSRDSARPYSARLARFLGQSATPDRETAPGSRMRFFSVRTSPHRYAPKSASYIREILARIHRLLSGRT